MVGLDDESTGRTSQANIVIFYFHTNKIKTRWTLSAETLGMSVGVNAAKTVQGYFKEIFAGHRVCLRPPGYPDAGYGADVDILPFATVMVWESLCDCLLRTGKRPSEARLILDIEAIKQFASVKHC